MTTGRINQVATAIHRLRENPSKAYGNVLFRDEQWLLLLNTISHERYISTIRITSRRSNETKNRLISAIMQVFATAQKITQRRQSYKRRRASYGYNIAPTTIRPSAMRRLAVYANAYKLEPFNARDNAPHPQTIPKNNLRVWRQTAQTNVKSSIWHASSENTFRIPRDHTKFTYIITKH